VRGASVARSYLFRTPRCATSLTSSLMLLYSSNNLKDYRQVST